MNKKEFNPSDWLEKSSETHTEPIESAVINTKAINNEAFITPESDIEKLIAEIESRKVDITTTYENWLKIGFALSDAFQESGRNYFHRISQFYDGYTISECDSQYTSCLKSRKQGVTIKTLFHLAKEAGIIIKPNFKEEDFAPSSSERAGERSLPTFPDSLFPQLPEFLQKVCDVAETNQERDMLLVGAITTLSSCLPNVYGYYHSKKVFANLFLFVTAQASAGKGRLTHCRQLVNLIHKRKREEDKLLKTQYDTELAVFNATRKENPDLEKPIPPGVKLLFLPANSSSTGVFQLLSDNDGQGLMFETEGDTLANTFKSDYGNYSDGFRKSFHHETISYYRRTDRENVEIEFPRLSVVLSGTPAQVQNLIPNAENGLFSRFMFYFLDMSDDWADVFASKFKGGLDGHFDLLGQQFFQFYQALETMGNIEFVLAKEQEEHFNTTFSGIFAKYSTLFGNEYKASVRRLGLITFRTAMVLSALRLMETGVEATQLICEERDYQTAIKMSNVLVQHSAKVFSELPQSQKPQKQPNRTERFYNALPDKFARQDYKKFAEKLGIPDKTAQGYITKFFKNGLLHRDKQDCYLKPIEETEEIEDSKD